MILRCEAIFWRAAVSMRASSVRRFSRALRASWRMVLRSSRKPTSSTVGQRVGHGVRQLVELVAADPHSTALYLRASSVFTFLNISAYCAPRLAHLLGVGLEDHAHLLVDAVLERQLLGQAPGHAFFGHLQVAGGDHFGVDEVLDRTAAQITNVFAGENHGLTVRIAHRAAVCTLTDLVHRGLLQVSNARPGHPVRS